MITLLNETEPVARKQHYCGYCARPIEPGARYLSQRCADGGTAWTFKSHLDCDSAYWSWGCEEGEIIDLTDLTEGHLPPCWHAWNHDIEHWHKPVERFIGPPSPCTCEVVPYSYRVGVDRGYFAALEGGR